jgi:hypothetical protein
MCSVRISTGKPAIVTEVLYFPQVLQENFVRVTLIGDHSFLPVVSKWSLFSNLQLRKRRKTRSIQTLPTAIFVCLHNKHQMPHPNLLQLMPSNWKLNRPINPERQRHRPSVCYLDIPAVKYTLRIGPAWLVKYPTLAFKAPYVYSFNILFCLSSRRWFVLCSACIPYLGAGIGVKYKRLKLGGG